jgi:hypothetical protein
MADYAAYKSEIGNTDLNSGMIVKCDEARWKGYATVFEGCVVKSMSMTAGLSKKKYLQDELRKLSSSKMKTEDWVLESLMAYAREHSGGKVAKASIEPAAITDGSGAASASVASPSACAAAAPAVGAVAASAKRSGDSAASSRAAKAPKK